MQKKLLLLFIFLGLHNPIANDFTYANEIVPPVTYLAKPPTIDGILDDDLKDLIQRDFPVLKKSNRKNPTTDVTYRIAYGTVFLYLYIEAAGDRIIYRDRAYQNGDGFHMVLSIPEQKDEPTDEFYVLGFSPNKGSQYMRKEKFIWYRNIDLSFRPLEKTIFETRTADGKIGYELLIPWTEIYPYHPWTMDSIGFNLCYVQAVGDVERNFYYVLYDKRIQYEQSKRKYVKLSFETPEQPQVPQAHLNVQKHCYEGEDIPVQITTVSGTLSKMNLNITLLSGEGECIWRKLFPIEVEEGNSQSTIRVKTCHLPPGGYKIHWTLRDQSLEGEFGLSILPQVQKEKFESKLDALKTKISEGSYHTLQFRLDEICKELGEVKPYDTAGQIRLKITSFMKVLREAEEGNDVIAKQTGIIRRAHLSKVDDTLQPYSVKIPNNLDKKNKYPLLVSLHGSGTDDTKVFGDFQSAPDNFIEMAPYGRGTSNGYSKDHAQDDIREAIEDVMANYPVDPDKIVLTGFSMGGYGVYRTHYEMPDKFRALSVFSGHPNIANKYSPISIYPNFLKKRYLEPFSNIPIFIFHGGKDRNCPIELTRELVNKFESMGANVVFYFEEDKGHESSSKETHTAYLKWLEEVAK